MVKLLDQLHVSGPSLIYTTRVTPHALRLRTSADKLRALSFYLRNSTGLQFKTLVDIAAVDKALGSGRFAANYLFLSVRTNQRITVQLFVNETTTVPSLAAPFVNGQRLFVCAAWLEREVWDMFGLYFSEHGDLRRILTDYGFTGHPLRKDFPLTGFQEVLYDDAEGRVIFEPVELAQEFRIFHV
jgi:NADH:ubiquinone oxidoreductase subunit C